MIIKGKARFSMKVLLLLLNALECSYHTLQNNAFAAALLLERAKTVCYTGDITNKKGFELLCFRE